ncbi:tRNA lysidine(34) synthetase TilS [Acinetobacter radioresistens]|uniref:tRNA lysidine(34) synthetase TilS n=1 Tax=Acinetobacter radioresistens TaxID=40216 RepID=UPI00124F93A0|nr:tRNA lysidine(34) synthetase TilS [Acinetobacter radioresistens]
MRGTLPTFNEVWQREFRSGCLKQLEQFPPETSFLIGCSGGMDSMLLLYFMAAVCPGRIRAIYVDHQLQAQSRNWGVHVQAECMKLDVPCIVQPVHVNAGNLERQAREARYQAYHQHIKSGEVLVLAHHQQDQAETVLLRLFSGTGISGLSAMKQLNQRHEMPIWRPMLSLSREQICQWTEQLNISFIDDPSNNNTHYDRAWCRTMLWPLLASRFSKMQQAVSRTASLMQDADEILQEVLQEDLKNCGNAQQLDLARLKLLSKPRQRQLLSAWMKGEGIYRPAFEMVERIQHEVIAAKADAQAALHWNKYYYVRYHGQLHRLQTDEYLAEKNSQLIFEKSLFPELSHVYQTASGHYQIQPQAVGLSADLLKQNLVLTSRQGGERIHLYGRVGAWPLKKAIQEAQIFPWQRHQIQILSRDNVMLGVFTPKGFWLAQSPYCERGGWQPVLITQQQQM